MSSVDEIKSKIDILTLISSYVKLEKAGANWKGKCPFHNEKTPSFFVSPDRGSYYCFGCQAKGDIFTFVEEFEGLDFVGALKVLAEKAGVELKNYDKKEGGENNKLFSILEQATFFYEKKLSENLEALNYLRDRGIHKETIKEFRIGFAPLEWRSLHDFLSSRGVTGKDMLAVGIVKQKEGILGKYYDTFRGRIIFPIADSSGRVVGFSGRILIPDDKSPKYLNSPETKLFRKSEILFGLNMAKRHINEHDYSILVEGQMDLVNLHQAGLKNTVASSGTALASEQIIKLKRLSERMIMAYDGDSAGFLATNKSAKLALSLGMEVKVAHFPENKDPADLAKDDPKKLREIIGQSKHIIDFYIDSLIYKGLDQRKLGEEIRKNVLPYINELQSNIEKSHFVRSVAQRTYINEEAIWNDLKKLAEGGKIHYESTHSPPEKTARVGSIEKKIFGLILWARGNKERVADVDTEWFEKRVKEITGQRFETLRKNFEKDKDSLLFETDAYYNGKNNLSKEAEELLMGLEEEYLKKDFGQAMINLQKAEQNKNSAEILRYLEDCHRISQRINAIKTIMNAYESR